jgi:hypothetical protein
VKKAASVLITAFIAALAIPAMSQTLVVGTCKAAKHQYTTIQSAINAAPAYATVLVCPGTYAEQVTITRPLTLKGISAPPLDAPTVVPPAGGMKASNIQPDDGVFLPLIAVDTYGDSGSVSIQNLILDLGASCGVGHNRGGDGILYLSTNGTIGNIAIKNEGACEGDAIWMENDSSAPMNMVVKDNIVQSFPKSYGIVAAAGPSGSNFSFQIRDNVITAVAYPVISMTNGNQGTVSGNMIQPSEVTCPRKTRPGKTGVLS